MIQVGQRFTLDWPRYDHLLDCVVIALEQEHVVAEVTHRCSLGCYLMPLRRTLPLDGLQRYDYDFFGRFFVPLAVDAIAIGPAR